MKKPEEHISHSLAFIKNNKAIRNKLLVVEVNKHLIDLFGTIVEEYLSHIRVQHKTLHLYLSSSTLKHQLYHDKQKLLDRLHEQFGHDIFEDIQLHG